MTTSHLLFLLIVFLIVAGIVTVGVMVFSPRTLRERLDNFTGSRSAPSQLETGGWVERVAQVAQPFTHLSLPEEGWEKSTLRTRFMNAGWRHPSAPTLYFASKTALALLVPALCAPVLMLYGRELAGGKVLGVLLLGAAFGYYAPNALLERLIQRRRREIFET